MIDYHLHTSRCCHATGSMEEYLAEAEVKQLQEIGFADHFPLGLLDYSPRVQVTMHPGELEEYIKQVEGLKENTNGLVVKAGIEVDYLPGTEEKLASLLGQYRFDYVIGSIHFMDDWDFTHPVYADDYKNKDILSLYSRYFALIKDLCSCGLFDIVGHIDVIKKFGYSPDVDLEPFWFEIAKILAKTETCFELNTAGRDAPVGEFYPGSRFLEICFQEGVAVTIGSDAHSPEQVGRYFPEAIRVLRQAGFSELAVFENRIKSSRPIRT
jgi:histidinol-phosphatase (PHP family)